MYQPMPYSNESDGITQERSFSQKLPFFLSSIMLSIYIFTVINLSNVSLETARISQIIGIIMVGVFIIEFLIHKQTKIYIPNIIIGITLFVVWANLSIFWAIELNRIISPIVTLFQMLILFFVATNIILIRGNFLFEIIGFIIGIAGAIFSTLSTYGFSLIPVDNIGRIDGTLGNANLYAVSLTFGILLILYLFNRVNKLTRVFFVIFVLLSIHQIFFFTGSRKGMIGIILVFSLYIIINYAFRLIISPKYLIALILSIVLLNIGVNWLVNNTRFANRLTNIDSDTSNQVRYDMIEIGISKWLEQPINGYGPNHFGYFYQNIERDTYSHNNYVELLVNNGLVGAFFFYSFHIAIVYRYVKWFITKQISSIEVSWGLIAILLIIIWDIFMVSYYEKTHWIIFSLLIAHQEIHKQAVVQESE